MKRLVWNLPVLILWAVCWIDAGVAAALGIEANIEAYPIGFLFTFPTLLFVLVGVFSVEDFE